jgi:hypothetical protein
MVLREITHLPMLLGFSYSPQDGTDAIGATLGKTAVLFGVCGTLP